MYTQNRLQSELNLPDKQDSKLAKQSSKKLEQYVKLNKIPTFQMTDEKGKVIKINLPASAFNLLINILSQMSKGNAVTLIPVHAELTTQEAADLLNVSRPYLVKILDSGEIPYHKVGTRRRVLAEDILKYKSNIDNARLKTLEKLSQQAHDLDMGYE